VRHKDLQAELESYNRQLRSGAVARVSFKNKTPNAEVFRRSFIWDPETGVTRANDVLSFVGPPAATILETDVLPPAALYVPSHAHQLHSFIVQVRGPRM
jgi:hypothetical protein